MTAATHDMRRRFVTFLMVMGVAFAALLASPFPVYATNIIAKVGNVTPTVTRVSAASVTPGWDSGATLTAGDLLIGHAYSDAGTAATTASTGWTLVGEANTAGATATRVSLWYKIATGGDAAPTFSDAGAVIMEAYLEEFNGNSAAPLQSNTVGTATGTTTVPTVTEAATPSTKNGISMTTIGWHLSSPATSTETPGSGWTSSAFYTASANAHMGGDFHSNPSTSSADAELPAKASGGATNRVAEVIAFFGAAPSVTSISPNAGPLGGGTSVSISGGGFTGVTGVKFGSTAASSFSFVSDTSVTATSPAESAGVVDVTVTTPAGTSSTSTNDQFAYTTAPTVTAITPVAGPPAGGTVVVVTGTGFQSTGSAKFGANAATGYTFTSSTSITITSPAGAGLVDVTVTNPGGTSATSSADHFVYKIPLIGLLDRNGPPPNSTYRPFLGGYVPNGANNSIAWSEMVGTGTDDTTIDHKSTTACSTYGYTSGGNGNPLDCAIAEVDAWNAGTGHTQESLKVRINSGVDSPAQALTNAGSFTCTDGFTGATGSCPKFWTSAFNTDWQSFVSNLATAYDSKPEIGEIVMDRGMTIYNEQDNRGVSTKLSSVMNGLHLPQTTITCGGGTSCTNGLVPFAGTNSIYITDSNGQELVTCTGSTGSTWTGCSGGTGTLSTNGIITTPQTEAMIDGGFVYTTDETQITDDANYVAGKFLFTKVGEARNPYRELHSDYSSVLSTSDTTTIMTNIRAGSNCVSTGPSGANHCSLENNSIRPSYVCNNPGVQTNCAAETNYHTVYSAMVTDGTPIGFQTAVDNSSGFAVAGDNNNCTGINGLYDTVYAIGTKSATVTPETGALLYNGEYASHVELPGGYDGGGSQHYCVLSTTGGNAHYIGTLQGLFSSP